MFENNVLKKTFEPKSEKVTEEWWRFHQEEIHDLKFSPNIFSVRKLKKHLTGGACVTYGREKRCIQDFGGEM
jgi:hypothetical protein